VTVTGKMKALGPRADRIVAPLAKQQMPDPFLLTVFAKGERADLTKAERNALARLSKALVEGYRRPGGGSG
jgi:hypothetical protein